MSICLEDPRRIYQLPYRKPMQQKVKRVLFGPVDHEITRRFIDKELRSEIEKTCNAWNFDFQNEKTLDPEGEYIWGPPSPVVVNRKRKLGTVVDQSVDQYFIPTTSLFEPIHPQKDVEENDVQRLPKQKRITDFMVVKKKTESPSVKEISSGGDRAAKISRMADCSS